MAQSKLASLGNRVWSAVKELRFSFDHDEKVCLQCYRPVDPRERFCSQPCCMQYWREFQVYCFSNSGKNVCSLPGCSKPCYVEPHGRIHDYCGRTHASDHAAMMDASSAGKKSKSKWNGSKSKGHQSKSHAQSTDITALSPSYWYAKHDDRRGPIHFYNRDDPYYEFTNFYPASICLDGKTWPTSEHYFQAQKFTGTPYVEQIRLLARPRQAFDLSRNRSVSRWRRSDWEDIKLNVMYKALLAKFTQHDELRTLLLLTRERKLIEHTPHDGFWGDAGDGTGLNHLGKMLMTIRSQLQGGKQSAAVKQNDSPSPHCPPTVNQPPVVVVEHLKRSALGENAYENSTDSDRVTRAQAPVGSAFPSHSEPTPLTSLLPQQQPNRLSCEDSMEDAPDPSFYKSGSNPTTVFNTVPFSPTSQQPPYLLANQQLQYSQIPLSSSQHLAQGVYTSTQGLTNPEAGTTTVPSAGQFQQIDMHSSNPMQQLPGKSNDLTTPGCGVVSHQASSGQAQSRWMVEDKPLSPGCPDSSHSKPSPGCSHFGSGPAQTEEPMQTGSPDPKEGPPKGDLIQF